jgi:6-pyruvoyltetrahydropterin/6-carboxytetrahydropterin synthase
VRVRLVKVFSFEAAHFLPRLPTTHKCSRIHGHHFQVDVTVQGPVDPELGWFVDYAEIARAWEPLHEALDHRILNEVEGLENPTSENLAGYIWQHLTGSLPGLCRVVVHETCQARCEYEGE